LPTKWEEVIKEEFSDTLIFLYYEAFGKDNTKRFIELFGGTNFYVPRWAEFNRVISKEKRGENDVETDL